LISLDFIGIIGVLLEEEYGYKVMMSYLFWKLYKRLWMLFCSCWRIW